MKWLGDTREYVILSLELIGFVASLPVVIPGFAAYAIVAYEGWPRLRSCYRRIIRVGE